MKKLNKNWLNWAARGFAAAASVVIISGAAQSPPVIPTVDLSVGPLAVNTQAVNIALALSVEFPTAGAAYRTAQYNHATEYLGYWDPKGCYEYFDETDTSALAGNYFRRTGSVDGTGYCNTGSSGSGYSGNLLNYAATSSIDLLRYALTGGDRVLDTTTKSVLGRAFLPTNFAFRDGTYFPGKEVAPALVGLVTPIFANPSGAGTYTGTVYFSSCDDLLYVGNSNSVGSCATPGNANIFAPRVPSLPGAFTTSGFVTTPVDTASTTYVLYGTKYWDRSQPTATVTVLPTGIDPDAGVLVPEAVSPTPRNFSVITGTGTSPQYAGDPVVTVTYTATAGTTTTTPTSGPLTIVGSQTATFATRYYQSAAPAGAFRTLTYAATWNLCTQNNNGTTPGTFRGALTAAGAFANVASGQCGTGIYAGLPNRRNITTGRTVYEPYITRNVYQVYTPVSVYNNYQLTPAWYQASVYTVYKVYTNGTTPGKMKAYVQVCDGSEATSRSDLCLRYPNGNHKPAGEIQRRAESVRVAAFGYALDNVTTRYGGVLRAPMRFTGPEYRDPAGAIVTNPSPEWDVNSGIFTADPLGASPTYTRSGVLNYLNKFGNTGAYKGFDPVGELYYEALRYFQGLGPTAAASSGLTAAMYDNFPIYDTVVSGSSTTPGWTDPVQNACQRRNFILAIGDVNTHRDRQVAGYPGGVGSDTAADAARGAESLLGDATKTLDSAYWTARLTGFETGVSRAYTDSLGRAQDTTGNPNVVASNTNLEGKGTGSGNTSGYYWAGAAYWANTQSIRLDTKGGQSMKDVRVKTFTIDVDEGGNGLMDGNSRGIQPRNSAFYLAGKYGWFNDANLDGNPFKTAGGVTNNTEWQDSATPNTPDGYVIASQAQKMIDGIRKFFSAATSEKGAISVSAVSSQRFTTNDPNGDLFAPRFDTRDWSGTIERTGLKLNTTTGTIDTLPVVKWDSAAILTSASLTASSTVSDPYVKPADRNIFTMSRDGSTTSGQAFSVSNKGNLDAAVLASLNTNPAISTVDSQADARINWIRGNRSNEKNATTGFLRARRQIMGDVINSGPVFKQGVDPDIRGAGYTEFAQSMASRTPVVYVGANDGMMHAFRATDGKELFAYIPRAVSQNLNKLTNPAYVHQPYVDGVPAVGEAQIGTDWKTVLASGMGGGAQGVFALDVTAPSAFSASNVLFEFTDQDDADMGNVLSQPKIVKMRMAGSTTPEFKWFLAVGSGYNNYKNDGNYSLTGRQALFLLSLDKAPNTPWTLNTNYYKIVVTDPVTTTAAGMSNPGFVTGAAGEVTAFYSGDLQGNLWKFGFSGGLSSTNAASSIKVVSGSPAPMFIARDSASNRQPITISPVVTSALGRGYMVVFGTGKFVEPTDSDTTGTQSIYGVWDNQTTDNTDFQIGRSKLYQRSMVQGTSTITLTGSETFTFGTGSTGNYRGWYVDLPNARERIATEGTGGLGAVAFNSTIPDGTCSGDGGATSMCFNTIYGNAACEFTKSTAGLLSRPNFVTIDDASEAYSLRTATGRRLASLKGSVISTGTKITDAGNVATSTAKVAIPPIPGGRLGWREIRNFKEN